MGAPSSQYCWWKVPKPPGGHSPGAQSSGRTLTSGVSTRKRLKLRFVTCTAAEPASLSTAISLDDGEHSFEAMPQHDCTYWLHAARALC